MPIYLYWGDDSFSLNRAIATLRDRTLDPAWASFNADQIGPEVPDATVQALNQAMTPPFGMGQRFVWLVNATICQRCPEEVLAELERALPHLPESTVLLITSETKPDGRLKSTKLLQKYAEIREFAAIPPWKIDLIEQQVRKMAQDMQVKLAQDAVQLLAASVGNDTRQLAIELEKLSLYHGDRPTPIPAATVSALVNVYTQTSLKLAIAIREGNTSQALTIIEDLMARNEAPLRIVAVLVGQFRTWLWVKLMVESGERDERAIARAAEVHNPKQVYFLQRDVRSLSLRALQASLPLLLELEAGLKRGETAIAFLQTKVIELCQLFQSSKSQPSPHR
jgi:DNA polymerase-3 subunit delta